MDEIAEKDMQLITNIKMATQKKADWIGWTY
jgi:hypothetical protein